MSLVNAARIFFLLTPLLCYSTRLRLRGYDSSTAALFLTLFHPPPLPARRTRRRDREGGYTRVLKLNKPRRGDSADMAGEDTGLGSLSD